MKKMRSEYKLVLILFSILLVFIVIFLFNERFFEKERDKIKMKEYYNCYSDEKDIGFKYDLYECIVTDDNNEQVKFNYPQIKIDNSTINRMNKRFSSEFDNVKRKIELVKDKLRFYFGNYNSSSYDLFYYQDIGYILKISTSYDSFYNDRVKSFEVYAFNVKTGKIYSNNEIKDILNFSTDLSSRMRMKAIEYYALTFNYDYIGKLKKLRDLDIDRTIESITYNSLNKIFCDNDGNIFTIMFLYNPVKSKTLPFIFKIDKNGIIEFSEYK